MNYDEFIKAYNGKGFDYDGVSSIQCVDLIKMYLDKVLNIKPGSWGNAKDYYENFNNLPLKNYFDRIANTPTFVPQKGDIVIWGTGLGNKYGHIAIATGEGNTRQFYSYDLNWGSKVVHKVLHNYTGFLGVLRAKDQNKINGKQENQNIDFFNAELYNMLYVDLQNAFGGNTDLLKEHYKIYGIKEGRIASYVFDPIYYLNKYEDLKNAFGNDYFAAYNHFLTYGIDEGRQANKIFDVKYYLENNIDLQKAFGTNYKAVINHFLTYGISEWRKTSKEFDVNVYKNNYEDLRNAYGENCAEYYKHYLLWGKDEDRKTI